MAAPLRPAASKAYLRNTWVFVPTIAGYATGTGPTAAEVTGASSLDVTLMLFDDSAQPSQSTNLARAPKRLGDGVTYEFVGETQATIGELRYQFDPQAAAGSNGKKAKEKLTPGTTGFLVNRRGIDINTAVAAAQFVDVYPVELGPQLPVSEGDAEGAENAIVQTVAQTGPMLFNVAVA